MSFNKGGGCEVFEKEKGVRSVRMFYLSDCGCGWEAMIYDIKHKVKQGIKTWFSCNMLFR